MSKQSKKLPISSGFKAEQPFNGLPPLPPRANVESRAVLKKCVSASKKLAALKEAAALIPNQDVLINSIPLREAKDSSAIENIVTTNDKLFRYANADPEQADPATKETLRYRTALLVGFENIRKKPLCTRTAIEICRVIKNIDLDIRKTPGAHLRNHSNNQIVYTPPEGETVLREKMANWEAFLHDRSDMDPLVKMAIAHYQFEAIHPFPDGNGRTGRILNILYLIDQGLLDVPIIYLSRFINDQRNDYYRLLLDVTVKQDWENWILYMLNAVEETAGWTYSKIWSIKRLMDETVRHMRLVAPKIYSHELVEIVFLKPYMRIGDFVDAGIGTRKTVASHLSQLVACGMLTEQKTGREKLYIHTKFLELLMNDDNLWKPYA